jgi:polysaccharide biosynthesis transport protein
LILSMSEERKPREEQALQPTYVLAPGYYPEFEPDDQVSLGDYIRVLWKRRKLILLVTLGCALAAFLTGQLLPPAYEARATLLVQRPIFITGLRPEPLGVDTYRTIVDSDFVKNAVRRKLVDDGSLRSEESLGSLSTEIYTSRVRDQTHSPVIDLVVRAGTPRIAALVADTWAEVAVRESSGLATRGKEGTLELIRREYPSAKDRLSRIEADLKATQDRFDREIRDLENHWDVRIAEFRSEWSLEVLREQAKALSEKLTEDIVRLRGLALEISEAGDTLDQLKKEIQDHPQLIVLSKAITDDALWERIGRDLGGETAEQLQSLRLRSEELNPVYQSLLQNLADTQVRYDTLVPQERHLRAVIADQDAELRELNRLILTKDAELQRLTRERDTQLTLLNREREFQVADRSREVETSREAFKGLAEKWEEARLAGAEQDEDIKIGALAVEPRNPVSPRPLLYTAVAFAVGLMLSLMLAFLVEFVGTGALGEERSGSGRAAYSPVTLHEGSRRASKGPA